MIFVTIGTQEPFDRLIKIMDEVALKLNDTEIVAQVFKTSYKIQNMKTLELVSPKLFDDYLNKAELIITHAGIGTIISALVSKKPIIIMPRLHKFNEHRNDHQLATARKVDSLGYVHVAYNEEELKKKILELWPNKLTPLYSVGNIASDELTNSIKGFLNNVL